MQKIAFSLQKSKTKSINLINMENLSQIKSVAIYPPLGIARVGNSDEFFYASDVPGVEPTSPTGYKDSMGRVKKQVARFRIYGFDADGKVVKELTMADGAAITWRVHAVNRKAAWYQFNNALDLGAQAIPSQFRNKSVVGNDRNKLVIDPGARSISGSNVSGDAYQLTGGKFFEKEVPLGEIRTDDAGRLLFFGGEGSSASRDGSQATTFANNDGWHDDVSDGTIYATVTINGQSMEAEPAMVAVTPPNFGMGLFGVVTMYDVVYNLYIQSGWAQKPATLNFYKHIYPILERTVQTQWVNNGFYFLFGQNSPSDFTQAQLLEMLSDPSDASKAMRERVFHWYRKPDTDYMQSEKIPPFYGDAFGDYENVPNVDLPLTETQYEWMQQWANGDFETGAPLPKPSFDEMSPEEQLESLNIAPLEECLGGPFHPGIEITWPFRNLIFWEKPYRIKILPEGTMPADSYGPVLTSQIALAPGGPLDGSGPGSLTRWLGVPWQTDEASCLSGYNVSTYLSLPSFWAARVPNQVLSKDSFKRLSDASINDAQRLKHFDYRQDWLRDLGTQYVSKINKMIAQWSELGIIARHPLPEGSQNQWLPNELWLETDRGDFLTNDPSFQQVKIAENADMEIHRKVMAVLEEVSGIVEEPARPQRMRTILKRDEM